MNILSTRYFAHIDLFALMKVSVNYLIDHVIGILSILNKV